MAYGESTMKKTLTWRLWLPVILVAASALTYYVHYLIFHDVCHIFIYLVGDIAFLFIYVLIVVLVVERLLSQREKRSLLNKLNMVIGTFFSEVGLELLSRCSAFILNVSELQARLAIKPAWRKKEFEKAIKETRNFSYEVRMDKEALQHLQRYLIGKRTFLLQLLDNPNLLEHERFTDVLWAVFHLAEELSLRGDRIIALPAADYGHLEQDLKRAYSHMVSEWIAHAQHLKESYPFLFSLAVRIHPFSPNPSAIITS
jgi:hypothetical protein